MGPLFEAIPRVKCIPRYSIDCEQEVHVILQACLAAMICIATKRMLLRVLDLKSLWRISKLDFMCWNVAALGTIFLDVVSNASVDALMYDLSVKA